MAVVRPFRGVRYNPDRITNLDDVVSQPYDRITPELAEAYANRSPYNITGIILGHDEDDSLPASTANHGEAPYQRARQHYEQWLADGILMREPQPAIYAYEQTFTVGEKTFVRLGFIGAVALTEFEEGVILPHERTHSGPKRDRMRLLQTLQVNPEQIFLLYPDPQNRVNQILRAAIGNRAPDLTITELFEHEVAQRVWVITSPDAIEAVHNLMRPMRGLIIADGHHRYETALAYRRDFLARHPETPPDAAVNFISATLVSMDDPGLVVLPTHREIRNFTATSPAEVLDRASALFDTHPATDLDGMLAEVNRHPRGLAFGFYGGPQTGFHVLTLKPEIDLNTLIDDPRSTAWKSLAVTVLHRVLLDQIARVPREGIEDKTMICYHRDPCEPVRNVDAGRGNFAFFLSPTTIEQIKSVAARGEKMPQKSTDFYPKMISGIVMLPIGADENLPLHADLAALSHDS
ncbi:MAG: DUF1015 domain-containing protein [Anaerolineae bacterium]